MIDPRYEESATKLLIAVGLLIAGYVALRLRSSVRLRATPLLFGFLSLAALPFVFAADERLLIEVFALYERTTGDPTRDLFRVARVAIPFTHAVLTVMIAGSVTAALAKSHASVHALAAGLLYPVAAICSALLLLRLNLFWTETYVLLGGEVMVFTPIVAVGCLLFSWMDVTKAAAIRAFYLNVLLVGLVTILCYRANQALAHTQVREVLRTAALGSGTDGPQICSGVMELSDGGRWWGRTTGPCPSDYAVYASNTSSVYRYATASQVSANVTCCPLPADDILLDEHVWELERCPDGYVASSGASNSCEKRGCPPIEPFLAMQAWCSLCNRPLRCTKINDSRYRLGEASRGALWGSSSTAWKNTSRIMAEEVPPSIRYGISRVGRFDWIDSGCVGFPFGSLLVGKSSKRCQGYTFRQLQYAGAPGDPPAGTPVEMFPECSQVTNLFDGEPECVGARS